MVLKAVHNQTKLLALNATIEAAGKGFAADDAGQPFGKLEAMDTRNCILKNRII